MKKLSLVTSILAAGLMLTAATTIKPDGVVMVPASENAYIVADVSTTEDPQGLRDRNFKDQQGILVSYANKVQAEELAVGLGLAKFDLTPVKGKRVTSAVMQMYALQTNLSQPARLVDLSIVTGQWSEADVTYTKKPDWLGDPIATEAVYGSGRWYSWDVTPTLTGRPELPADISYVLGLRSIDDKSAEQVIFAAKAAGINMPRLVVTYEATSQPLAWWIWAAGGTAIGIVAFGGGFAISRAVRRKA